MIDISYLSEERLEEELSLRFGSNFATYSQQIKQRVVTFKAQQLLNNDREGLPNGRQGDEEWNREKRVLSDLHDDLSRALSQLKTEADKNRVLTLLTLLYGRTFVAHEERPDDLTELILLDLNGIMEKEFGTHLNLQTAEAVKSPSEETGVVPTPTPSCLENRQQTPQKEQQNDRSEVPQLPQTDHFPTLEEQRAVVVEILNDRAEVSTPTEQELEGLVAPEAQQQQSTLVIEIVNDQAEGPNPNQPGEQQEELASGAEDEHQYPDRPCFKCKEFGHSKSHCPNRRVHSRKSKQPRMSKDCGFERQGPL